MAAPNIALEDAAPLMRDIELALTDKRVQMVRFRNEDTHKDYALLTRSEAERLLSDLERRFFATVH